MPILELDVASGASLSVRRFRVREAISEPFTISVTARTADPSLDLGAIVGQQASFRLASGVAGLHRSERSWTGVCRFAELDRVEPTGLSTYRFELVATLWLLTQRRCHRIVQHRSGPDAARVALDRWGLSHALDLDRAAYPALPYKVQYGETDYAFFCRMLEECGVAFVFPEDESGRAPLTLSDRLHAGEPRAPAIAFVDSPDEAAEREFVTALHLGRDTRPGALVLRDFDPRRPALTLVGEAPRAPAPEEPLERYDYRPGAFLAETGRGMDPPVVDARHDAAWGRLRAERALAGARADRSAVSFRTNVVDLWPGRVFTITDHPHPDLTPSRRLLATELTIEGAPGEDWTIDACAVPADTPYRPPARTPRPRARLQSATVTSPTGAPIHVDDLGRVQVHFPWDRGDATGDADAATSCWIHVSQGWAGAGYGMIDIPRLGQEVLVDFLQGDPEQPVIIGRAHNTLNPVVYELPEHQTRSGWKSDSSPGSGGYNEIFLEDASDAELVRARAEKDLRRLVKRDETITIGRQRDHSVQEIEREATLGNRAQVTCGKRVEETAGSRTTVIDGTRRERVGVDAIERLDVAQRALVGGDRHLIVHGVKRERVDNGSHLAVDGDHCEAVGGTRSLSVGEALDESVGTYGVLAGSEIHLIAGSLFMADAGADLTVKSGGNFITIAGGDVLIVGNKVYINEGGSPGDGPGVGPKRPELPREASGSAREPEGFVEVVFDDPPLGHVASIDIDLRFADGSTDKQSTNEDGAIFVTVARGPYVDATYNRANREHRARVFLKPPDAETTNGGWQRLVNLGYVNDDEPGESPSSPQAFKTALRSFQSDFHLAISGTLDANTSDELRDAHDQDRRPWKARLRFEPEPPSPFDETPKSRLT